MVNTNVIYCGDCLTILKGFPDECIDLIYLDPPFYSGKPYEFIWGNHAEKRAFEDRWKGGINHYIGWMEERLEQCHRVLKKEGSIYLHCDYHASHYLKLKMDKIFDENNFRNEIVWHYKKWSAGWKQFQRNHDIILFYSKTDNKKRVFNKMFMERAESTLKRFGTAKIISGYDEKTGKRIPSQMAKEESEGVPMDDVWNIGRVPPIKQMYPTQKPEALVERIIKASSNKNDIILDPFVGGGTTLVGAYNLDRKWIGIDVSPTACKVAQKRLLKIGIHPVILGLPTSINELKKLPHFEFQNWVCKQLNGKISDNKSSDMGIDGWILGTIPIQVKQSDNIGRNPIDNFVRAVERAGKKKGVFVAFSFGKGAVEEVARTKESDNIEIKLLTVEDILKADFNPMELF